MNRNQTSKIVRDTLANVVLNTATRIQKRRTKRGKRQVLKVNLASIPRRQGGFGKQGPIRPKIIARSVAANVGSAVSNLQSSAPRRETGSEIIANLVTQGVANVFTVIYQASLNPAEPGLVPMLAAKANQFQRFNTNPLKLTYTPSASATRDGTLYVCVYPNADATIPETVDEMMATGNAKSFPIYGQASTWTVDVASIQAAYKVQTIDVKDVYETDTTLNSSGLIVVATTGAGATVALGTLTWTYDYQLSVPRATQGSNTLNSHYHRTSPSVGKPVVFSDAHLLRGYENLIPTDVDGVYKMRIRQAPHLLILKTVGSSTGYSQELFTSPDAVTFTSLAPVFTVTQSAAYEVEGVYRVPATEYIKIQNDTSATLDGFDVICASLRP